MKKGVIALIAFIVLVAAGAFVLTSRDEKDTVPTAAQTEASTPLSTETPSATQDAAASIITYTDGGFSPASLTVKAGTKVTIKNNSSRDLQFSSDDHPTHKKNAELNQSTVGPGENQTFTPTAKGTWGYHNHENSTDTGTIVVQ